MAKSSNFEKRLASLEKTITEFFVGKPAKKKAAKRTKKAKKKTTKRKA